ncbi:AsmA family protein [Pontibacter burrus]|uniref:DUF748 domain-containing protein n=1 Tax=Pontibacter burrus TaxID=2704466 RepID=A0A6B3LUR3_9BACT|nr:hypothetical protein [Pontibacter burrus]NEM98735.1 hypothetical protein [Pontibacter burrus]
MVRIKNTATSWRKIGAWILALALIVLAVLFLAITRLPNQLERMVAEESGGLYALHLHGFSVSPFTGNLSVDSLVLEPDTVQWHKQVKLNQRAPRILFKVRMKAFEATDVNLFGIMFGLPAKADQLTLKYPAITLIEMHPDTSERQKAFYQTAKGDLKGMHVGSIKLDSASLKYKLNYSSSDYLLDVSYFNLKAEDFRLDSSSYVGKGRAYYARQIDLKTGPVNYKFTDGMYHAIVGGIALNTQAQTIDAKELHLKPLLSALNMSAAKGESVTTNDLKISKVHVSGMDYAAYSRHNALKVQHMLLDCVQLSAHKNRKTKQPEKQKPTLHQMAREMGFLFKIDTLEVKNGFIRYSELAPEGKEPGYITLNGLKGSVINLSNMPEHMSDETPALLQCSFRLMNEAPIDVNVLLPLLHKEEYHALQVTFGPLNPAILNPMLVPVSYIKVKNGNLSSGSFKADLTAKTGTGSMIVYYNNLEIELLNKGEPDKQSLGNKLLSKVADWVAIKDANPMPGEKPRMGTIAVTRDPTKSILHHWKSCAVSGLLSTIGLDKIAEK